MARRWVYSRSYRRLAKRRRYLKELRKRRHYELIRRLMALRSDFYIEDMDWRALGRRAKKIHRKKNGRNATKKRFGKSIANRAPGAVMVMLEQFRRNDRGITNNQRQRSYRLNGKTVGKNRLKGLA